MLASTHGFSSTASPARPKSTVVFSRQPTSALGRDIRLIHIAASLILAVPRVRNTATRLYCSGALSSTTSPFAFWGSDLFIVGRVHPPSAAFLFRRPAVLSCPYPPGLQANHRKIYSSICAPSDLTPWPPSRSFPSIRSPSLTSPGAADFARRQAKSNNNK